jgi:hypothetical protein
VRRLLYLGWFIVEASPARQAEGFRWCVDLSKVDARDLDDCPHFYQLPAAKGFIREELLDESFEDSGFIQEV